MNAYNGTATESDEAAAAIAARRSVGHDRRRTDTGAAWPFGALTEAQEHARALTEAALRGDPRAEVRGYRLAPAAGATVRATDSLEHQLDTYRAMLKRHDWQFEHCDDQRGWNLGRMSLAMLRDWQQRLDPNGAIWNSRCPLGHEIGNKPEELAA